MLDLKISRTKTYLLACSFGPDSMALLDKLLALKIHLVVCHVNYHKRDVSDYEETSLREYCKKHNIPFEVLDSRILKQEGNFQSWARDIRYQFFAKCYQKYNANGLFVAHQQDDLIETYIMQKARKNYVSYYGIKPISQMNGMTILRPLLDTTKADLLQYVKNNDIPYSIDISNLTDHYSRNKIRHSIVEKLSIQERKEYIAKIDAENLKLESIKEKAKVLIHQNCIFVDEAKNVEKDVFVYALFNLCNACDVQSISYKRIDAFSHMLSSNKSNIEIKLTGDVYYYQEYGKIHILKREKGYIYLLNKPGIYKFEQFDIDFTDAIDRNIYKEDYPLTIRPAKSGDVYLVNNYKVKVRRLYIDWKMPKHIRYSWPVIVNRYGVIIYIPRYRETFKDNHKSTFAIKIN